MRAGLRQLDPVESAGLFRRLLAAASEPGRIERLEAGDLPAVALVPLVLADLDTTIHVELDDAALRRAILDTTGAREQGPDAEMVVSDRARPELVSALSIGSTLAPERGCRLVLTCTGLEPVDPAVGASERQGRAVRTLLRLRGPGVSGPRELLVTGIATDVFEALAGRNSSFPAGIDTCLVTPSGDAVMIPRSTGLVAEEG